MLDAPVLGLIVQCHKALRGVKGVLHGWRRHQHLAEPPLKIALHTLQQGFPAPVKAPLRD
jgi:hypothetical protein